MRLSPLAIAAALARAFVAHRGEGVGNFWADLTRTTLYVLLPAALILAVALAGLGVVQSLAASVHVVGVEGGSQTLPLFPAMTRADVERVVREARPRTERRALPSEQLQIRVVGDLAERDDDAILCRFVVFLLARFHHDLDATGDDVDDVLLDGIQVKGLELRRVVEVLAQRVGPA